MLHRRRRARALRPRGHRPAPDRVALSRQISRLEQQLGARLLDRTPRGTRLTEAGEVFLPLATAVLRSAAQAAARTRAAARPSRITIGYITNTIVTPAVRELRHRHPDAEVRTLHLAWNDIADEPLPRARRSDPVWDAFWRVDPRPDGSPAPDGPLIEAVEDKIELIAEGQAVAIVPAGAHVNGVRPDLTTIPLEGVEASHVLLATRAGDRGRLVMAFRKYAQAHLGRA